MTIKEFKIQYALGTLSYDVKKELAENSTSKKILSMLSKDEDWSVRNGVAYNNSAPEEILELLSKDEDWYVRYGVADNENTPIDILKVLSIDKDWHVKYNIAYNKNTPTSILKILSKDKDWHVRYGVTNNPNYKEQFMTAKEFEMQYALGTLSDDMKEKLASNKNTPKKILSILSKDESWEVKRRVAYNPNTPEKILKVLSKDEDKYIRCRVNEGRIAKDNPKFTKIEIGMLEK